MVWLVDSPIQWTKNSRVNFAWKHSNFKLQENFISMWYIIFVCICANIVRTVKIKNKKASHIPILNYLIIYIVFMVKILIACWAIWIFFKMENIMPSQNYQVESLFKCDKCEREYKTKSSLTRHTHVKHEAIDIVKSTLKNENLIFRIDSYNVQIRFLKNLF